MSGSLRHGGGRGNGRAVGVAGSGRELPTGPGPPGHAGRTPSEWEAGGAGLVGPPKRADLDPGPYRRRIRMRSDRIFQKRTRTPIVMT